MVSGRRRRAPGRPAAVGYNDNVPTDFMQIFLTGATGYLGGMVLDVLLRGGHGVTALVRDARRAQRVRDRSATAVVADLGEGESWREAAVGHDAFVHAAFDSSPRGVEVDRVAVETLITAAQWTGKHRPVLYTSGVWVLGPTRQPATEESKLAPIPLVAWRPAHEQLVLTARGIRPLVVRPGVVYGGSHGLVGDLFREGMNGLIRVVGDGRNRWACAYDRDVADLYARLLTTSEASGVYHATDDADESVADIVEAIGSHMTHPPDVRHVPIEEARGKHGAYADALALDQVVRSPRARALGWTPSLRSVSGNVPRLLEEWRRGQAREAAVEE